MDLNRIKVENFFDNVNNKNKKDNRKLSQQHMNDLDNINESMNCGILLLSGTLNLKRTLITLK